MLGSPFLNHISAIFRQAKEMIKREKLKKSFLVNDLSKHNLEADNQAFLFLQNSILEKEKVHLQFHVYPWPIFSNSNLKRYVNLNHRSIFWQQFSLVILRPKSKYYFFYFWNSQRGTETIFGPKNWMNFKRLPFFCKQSFFSFNFFFTWRYRQQIRECKRM